MLGGGNATPPPPLRCRAAAILCALDLAEGGGPHSLYHQSACICYQDDEDKWQSTTSLQLSDLPAAIRVLQLAQEYVESVEAEVTT